MSAPAVATTHWARRLIGYTNEPGPAHRVNLAAKYGPPRSLCGPLLRGAVAIAPSGAIPADWRTCKQCERDAGEARR